MLSCLPYPPAALVPPPPPGAPSALPSSFTSLPVSSEAVVLAETLTSSFLPLSIIRLRSLGSRGDLEPLALRVGVKELGGRGIGSRGAGAFPPSVSVHKLLCHSLIRSLKQMCQALHKVHSLIHSRVGCSLLCVYHALCWVL